MPGHYPDFTSFLGMIATSKIGSCRSGHHKQQMFRFLHYSLCLVSVIAASFSGLACALLATEQLGSGASGRYEVWSALIAVAIIWWATAFAQKLVPGASHALTARRRQTTLLFFSFTCLSSLTGFLLALLKALAIANGVIAVAVFVLVLGGGSVILAYFIPDDDWDGRCHQCGYDLRGNQSGRCPECGERFSPDSH